MKQARRSQRCVCSLAGQGRDPQGGLGGGCGWAGTLQVPGRRPPDRGDREAEVLQRKRTAGLEVSLPAGVGEVEAEGPGFCPAGNGWNRMRVPPSTAIGSACDPLFSQYVNMSSYNFTHRVLHLYNCYLWLCILCIYTRFFKASKSCRFP